MNAFGISSPERIGDSSAATKSKTETTIASAFPRSRLALAAFLSCSLLAALGATAQERTIKIYGFGAKSGVVRIFGLNSEAAMKAPAE